MKSYETGDDESTPFASSLGAPIGMLAVISMLFDVRIAAISGVIGRIRRLCRRRAHARRRVSRRPHRRVAPSRRRRRRHRSIRVVQRAAQDCRRFACQVWRGVRAAAPAVMVLRLRRSSPTRCSDELFTRRRASRRCSIRSAMIVMIGVVVGTLVAGRCSVRRLISGMGWYPPKVIIFPRTRSARGSEPRLRYGRRRGNGVHRDAVSPPRVAVLAPMFALGLATRMRLRRCGCSGSAGSGCFSSGARPSSDRCGAGKRCSASCDDRRHRAARVVRKLHPAAAQHGLR